MARKAAQVAEALSEGVKTDPGVTPTAKPKPAPKQRAAKPPAPAPEPEPEPEAEVEEEDLEEDVAAVVRASEPGLGQEPEEEEEPEPEVEKEPEPERPSWYGKSIQEMSRQEIREFQADKERRLGGLRKQFAAIEMPMARDRMHARFIVVTKDADPDVIEVAKERGLLLCIGEPEYPDIGWSLHPEQPKGTIRVAVVPEPKPERPSAPSPRRAAPAFTREDPGFSVPDAIPVSYAAFVNGVSLEPNSLAQAADRSLNANQLTRDQERFAMGVQGPWLLIHVKRKRPGKNPKEEPAGRIECIRVPVTNCTKLHESKPVSVPKVEAPARK